MSSKLQINDVKEIISTLGSNAQKLVDIIANLTRKFFEAKINTKIDLENDGEVSWFDLSADITISENKLMTIEPAVHFSEKGLWGDDIKWNTKKPYVMVVRKIGKTINQLFKEGNFTEVSEEERIRYEYQLVDKMIQGSTSQIMEEDLKGIPTSMYTLIKEL